MACALRSRLLSTPWSLAQLMEVSAHGLARNSFAIYFELACYRRALRFLRFSFCLPIVSTSTVSVTCGSFLLGSLPMYYMRVLQYSRIGSSIPGRARTLPGRPRMVVIYGSSRASPTPRSVCI